MSEDSTRSPNTDEVVSALDEAHPPAAHTAEGPLPELPGADALSLEALGLEALGLEALAVRGTDEQTTQGRAPDPQLLSLPFAAADTALHVVVTPGERLAAELEAGPRPRAGLPLASLPPSTPTTRALAMLDPAEVDGPLSLEAGLLNLPFDAPGAPLERGHARVPRPLPAAG
jgi:hypothetical protein